MAYIIRLYNIQSIYYIINYNNSENISKTLYTKYVLRIIIYFYVPG